MSEWKRKIKKLIKAEKLWISNKYWQQINNE